MLTTIPPSLFVCVISFPAYGLYLFFFFNDTATTEIYTLSLHDALPISGSTRNPCETRRRWPGSSRAWMTDRKSTRLSSSHQIISYAVFCLKKKKNKKRQRKHGTSATPRSTKRELLRGDFAGDMSLVSNE